jgi:hypothetical protein
VKQKLTKLEGEVDTFMIVFGDFIIPVFVAEEDAAGKSVKI